MALELLIDGVDVLGYVTDRSISVKNTAYSQTGVLDFQLEGAPADFTVSVEDEVIFRDDTTLERKFAGIIRAVEPYDLNRSGWRRVHVSAQDYTSLLDDDVIDTGGERVASSESDADRISWLLTTFGTKGITVGAEVQELRATMPTQDFNGMTVLEAVKAVLHLTGGQYYVDYSKALHTFLTEANAAPFALSDAPNGTTTFGYKNLTLPTESTALKNAVYVIGGPPSEGEDALADWYEDATSIAAYGRREAVIKDERVTVQATLDSYGAAFLEEHANPRTTGSLITYTDGLEAGMNVQVTSAIHGLSSESFRIVSVTTSYPIADAPVFAIEFGDPPLTLAGQIGAIRDNLGELRDQAGEALTQIVNLTAAGANAIHDSSFENDSSDAWTVGDDWVKGSEAVDAFSGDKTAILTATGSDSGELVTTDFIPVNRLNDWWFSFYSDMDGYVAGTAIAAVREYSAAEALLATNTVEITANESDWTRHALRFGPNDVNRIAFHADTAYVKVAFYATSSPDMDWAIDGVQLESGKIITAYAPRPQELLDGSVGKTQIEDLSITTEKLMTNAVVAGKIAAGEIGAEHLQAVILLASLIKTDDTGARVEIDSEGIRAFGSDETLLVKIPTDGSPVYIAADVDAGNLTVAGTASITNELVIEEGAELIAQAGVVAPQGAPSVSVSNGEITQLEAMPAGATRTGGYYDSAGGADGATACFVSVVKHSGGELHVYEWELAGGTIDRTTRLDKATGGAYVMHHGFITRIGSMWYVSANISSSTFTTTLISFNRSTGVADTNSSILNSSFQYNAEYGWPIKTDGTYLYVAGPVSANQFKFVRVTTAFGLSATISLTEPSLPSGYTSWHPWSWHFDIADLGSGARGFYGMIATASGKADVVRIYEFNLSTGALVADTDFASHQGNDRYGFFWDGTNFYQSTSNQLTKLTNITGTDPLWFGYSWYDSAGTTHETDIGPLASVSASDYRRRRIRVATPSSLPGGGGADEPDSTRVYGLISAFEPSAGTLHLQDTNSGGGTSTLSSIDTGSAFDGIGTAFASSVPGVLRNAESTFGDWLFEGDGQWQLSSTDAYLDSTGLMGVPIVGRGIHKSTTQAISTASWTKVTSYTTSYMTGIEGSYGYSGAVQIGLAGYYLIQCGTRFGSLAADGRYGIGILVANNADPGSGTPEVRNTMMGATRDLANYYANAVFVVQLAALDVVTLQVWHDSGSDRNIDGSVLAVVRLGTV